MTKPLLSLLLPVKNEAGNIRGVLESVKPWVDRYTILDTGSDDGTPEVVQEVMAGVPGMVYRELAVGCVDLGLLDVVDFSWLRNRVMELDRGWGEQAEFQMMISGCEYLRGGKKLRDELDARRGQISLDPKSVDLFWLRVTVDSEVLYWHEAASDPQPRVFRTGGAWRYRDEVHETPTHPDKGALNEFLEGVTVEHVVDDAERRYGAIWENHIPVLKAMLQRDPKYARALVFLAQSYEVLMHGFSPEERVTYGMEAMSYLLRRLALPFDVDAERIHVETHLLDFARVSGAYTDRELLARAEDLFARAPTASIALMRAAIAAQTKGTQATRVYEFARVAAEVAERPVSAGAAASLTCAWKAHHLAATAAAQLAKSHPTLDLGDGETYSKLVERHCAAGIAAGGMPQVFEMFKRAEQGAA